MSGQGYHFAVAPEEINQFLSLDDEFDITDWASQTLEGLWPPFEGTWDREDKAFVEGGYKDWNILLYCLTNGTYDPSGGTYPLNRCFFGGRLLVREGSIVNLVMPEEVPDVAEALDKIDRQDFIERSMRLFPGEFDPDTWAEGEEYLNDLYFRMTNLREFYHRAAQDGRAVVFYTDDPLDYFFKGDDPPDTGTDSVDRSIS
jgi:hypothetical protein